MTTPEAPVPALSRLRRMNNLSGPSSLLGLIFVVWMETKSTVSRSDFEALRNTVARIEAEQQNSQSEYAKLLSQMTDMNEKLSSLIRLVCNSSNRVNKSIQEASGACYDK